MRKVLALVVVALLAVAVVPALAATKYRATLNGKSETPKSNSKATGSAVFTVASNGKSISYTLKATGLTGAPQAAHVHSGKAGQAGPRVNNLLAQPGKLPQKRQAA